MTGRLERKTDLVTGAGGAIGSAIVRAFIDVGQPPLVRGIGGEVPAHEVVVCRCAGLGLLHDDRAGIHERTFA